MNASNNAGSINIPPTISVFTNLPLAFKDIHVHQLEDPDTRKIMKQRPVPPEYSIRDPSTIPTLMQLIPGQRSPRVMSPNTILDLIFKYYHTLSIRGIFLRP